MNADYEKNLEAEIDGVLKDLPEVQAPSTLARRVMAAVRAREARPWYRQSWELWPAPLRYAALGVMIGSFAAFCFASWQLTRAAGTAEAWREVAQTFSGVGALLNALTAVLNGLVLACKHVNSFVLFGCLAFLTLAWGLCVGLGTACVRLALARR